MNLRFSTHWPEHMPEHMAGKPTNFIPKIWESLYDDYFSMQLLEVLNYDYDMTPGKYRPKIHTIRRDESNQWKKGYDIHFWINMEIPKKLSH